MGSLLYSRGTYGIRVHHAQQPCELHHQQRSVQVSSAPKGRRSARKARHSRKWFPRGDTHPGRETEGADGGPHIFTSNPPRIKARTVRHQSPKRHIRRLFLGGNAAHINGKYSGICAPPPRTGPRLPAFLTPLSVPRPWRPLLGRLPLSVPGPWFSMLTQDTNS